MAAQRPLSIIFFLMLFCGADKVGAVDWELNEPHWCPNLPRYMANVMLPRPYPIYPDYVRQPIYVECPPAKNCSGLRMDPDRPVIIPKVARQVVTWLGEPYTMPVWLLEAGRETMTLPPPTNPIYVLFGNKVQINVFYAIEGLNDMPHCRTALSEFEYWSILGTTCVNPLAKIYETPPMLGDGPLSLLYSWAYDRTSHRSFKCLNCDSGVGLDFISSRSYIDGLVSRTLKVVKHSYFIVDGQSFASPEELHFQIEGAPRTVQVAATNNHGLSDEELERIGWRFGRLVGNTLYPPEFSASSAGVHTFAVQYPNRPQDNYTFTVEVGDWED